MTKSEISKKRYLDERNKLLTLPWKDEIYIDNIYYCPVCDFKTDKLNKFVSHLGNKDLYDKIYEKYFGEIGKCENCGKKTRLLNFEKGYSRFCSEECTWPEKKERLNNIVEKRNIGLKKFWSNKEKVKERNKKVGIINSIKLKEYFSSESNEHREKRLKKQSETMKMLIKNGEYVPNINNDYNGKIILYNDKKYRSSWELLFHLIKPELKYEKTVIQYISPKDNKEHNYFVDFTDIQNNILYEVKPYVRQNDIINQAKFKATIKWCNINGFKFKIVDEFYLKENINKISKDKIDILPENVKRRLKCLLKLKELSI
jgi:hypothetical protein